MGRFRAEHSRITIWKDETFSVLMNYTNLWLLLYVTFLSNYLVVNMM